MAPNEAPAAAPAPERLLALIGELLGELRSLPAAPLVRLDDTLDRDLGLDSLSRMELALRVEREFGVRLDDNASLAARTPRDLLAAIAGAPARAAGTRAAAVRATSPRTSAGAPEQAATLMAALAWHVEHHGEREHITITDGDDPIETLTYGRLWSEGHAVARGLVAAGIDPGDSVALMLPTGAAFFRTFVGILLAGAVPVPLYPPTRWSEIEAHVRGRARILASAGARLLVTVPQARLLGTLAGAGLAQFEVVTAGALVQEDGERIARNRAAGDIALLQYTSGSTGDPKGVVLTHANLLANIRAMGRAAGVTSRDRFLSWLPLYHDMGLIGAWLGSLYFAVPLTIMPPTAFLARPARWLRAIHASGATMSAGPNFAYEVAASRIADEDLSGIDLSSWRLAFNGAEPVRAATLERFAARFQRYGFDRRALTPVYGLAESALGLTFPPLARGPRVETIDGHVLERDGMASLVPYNAASARAVVSCGRPLPGHAVRVVDDVHREVQPRQEGRIEFSGPSATSGYYRNDEATRRLAHDGWLDTGDVGYIADGELFVTSRAKDLIKRGGHNIHPYDLEGVVGEMPGVRKGCVAVFGTGDRASGTERVVVVAETHAVDARELEDLRTRIAALAPLYLDGPADEILLVPPRTVLKTSSGKIRRAACRDLYEKHLLTAGRGAVWAQLARLAIAATWGRAHRVAQVAQRALYGAWCVALVALVTPVLALLLMVLPGVGTRARAVRACARLVVAACGLPLNVRGTERLPQAAPMVFVANHASYVDAILLAALLPADTRFAAKRGFARTPVLGWVLRRLDACFVDRDDAAQGLRDVSDVVATVRAGHSVVFFPEGTFTRAPGLAPFRLGAFVVAATTGAPLVPVVLCGARAVLRDGQWLPARHPVDVVMGPVIRTAEADWSTAVRLRDEARALMLATCGEPDLAAS